MPGDFPACGRTACEPEDLVCQLFPPGNFLEYCCLKQWNSHAIKTLLDFPTSLTRINPLLELKRTDENSKDHGCHPDDGSICGRRTRTKQRDLVRHCRRRASLQQQRQGCEAVLVLQRQLVALGLAGR